MIQKPFREAHADVFMCDPAYEELFRKNLAWYALLGANGTCNILIDDGRIICIGGWTEVAPGVCEMFVYPSVYAKSSWKYQKMFYRETKWWIDYLKQTYRRLQCWGEDTPVSDRWLKHLGFEHEGTCKKFHENGSNLSVWGLTW